MPRKIRKQRQRKTRKQRRYARKRYNKRKRVYRQRLKVQVNRFPGWPEVLYTKLTYFENNYKFALGTNDKLNRFSFRLNSPYDPVINSWNKSANYWDDYMAHYKFCRVMGAKISIRIANDVTNSRQMQFALIPNPQNYAYKDMDEIVTQIRKKLSKWTNSIASTRTLSWYMPIHTILGLSKTQYISQLPGPDFDMQNTGIGGYVDVATPAQMDLYYAKINESGLFETQALGTVKITFYCKFYYRIPSKPLGGDIGEETLDDGETVDLGNTIFAQETLEGPDDPVFPVNPL